MTNKGLFKMLRGRLVPPADSINEAGGTAYALNAEQALAQYAATGCLNSTFYASAEVQLERVFELCADVTPEFIARVALYARREGRMKDLPALLVAILSVRSPGLMAEVFDRVIDSPKILRNFVQIMRSGVVGRKSLGTLPKRLICQWLERRSDEAVFFASIGKSPSVADIIRMVHPAPATRSREALLGYVIGRPHDATALPPIVSRYEAYKAGSRSETPNVPFQMLTALELKTCDWITIARNASWQATRMNLNSFARHGVFEDPEMVELIAQRLADPDQMARAHVLPYQLLVAHAMTGHDVPELIRQSLEEALERATANIPTIPGRTVLCLDVSGSMQSPITGHRRGSTTAVRCVDVASLFVSSILRKNPLAEVIPFTEGIVRVRINPRDTVVTNARLLASLPPGGTNCSAPLAELNRRRALVDTVIFVSDYESWFDSIPGTRRHGTATMQQWELIRRRCPKARLVCIDLQPYGTVQAQERQDVLNVGGFSDAVFDLVSAFVANAAGPQHWVDEINAVRI